MPVTEAFCCCVAYAQSAFGKFKKHLAKRYLRKHGRSSGSFELLDHAINEDAPVGITEGNIIKHGFDPEIDQLIFASKWKKTGLRELERANRKRPGSKPENQLQ